MHGNWWCRVCKNELTFTIAFESPTTKSSGLLYWETLRSFLRSSLISWMGYLSLTFFRTSHFQSSRHLLFDSSRHWPVESCTSTRTPTLAFYQHHVQEARPVHWIRKGKRHNACFTYEETYSVFILHLMLWALNLNALIKSYVPSSVLFQLVCAFKATRLMSVVILLVTFQTPDNPF
jgi:hypothetical protein